ncbi:hypothetical protein BGZ70_010554, partial [Mortierella alpina]
DEESDIQPASTTANTSTTTTPNQQDIEIFAAASVAFSPVIANILYAPRSGSKNTVNLAATSPSLHPGRDSHDDAASQRTLAPPSYIDVRPKAALDETKQDARVTSA